jgi:hypothetical protein
MADGEEKAMRKVLTSSFILLTSDFETGEVSP